MTQPTKWSAPLGSGADVQDLPDDDLRYASFSKIFPQITQVPLSAGGVAPRRVDFNSLFKLLADNIYFYQNGGVFEYSDTADYEKGALVRYNDKIYLCIQDNTSADPKAPSDSAYWSLIPTLADELGFKTGDIKIQTTSTIPSGWLLCNGAGISRSTFSNLFTKIGTTYGTGDGSTTFNIPDLRDRYIIGANTNALGTQIAEQLPNITGTGSPVLHTGSYAWDVWLNWAGSGAISAQSTLESSAGLTSNGVGFNERKLLAFNANSSNSIYQDNGKVYPLSLALNFIIKC